MARVPSVSSRIFVFANVLAFELAGAIHRWQPSHQMTTYCQRPTNNPRADFFHSTGTRIQFGKHLAYELAMMPLFVLDFLDADAFVRIRNRLPVPAVGIRCG